MKQLLEAGVHFGHQTRRWNPKMAPYIYTERNGIYIIDLQKTVRKLEEAYNFVRQLSESGQSLLFVGTKKQAQDAIREEAARCGMYYVNARWLGGMMTNFKTMRTRVDRLNQLKRMQEDGVFDMLPKKEVIKHLGEIEKLTMFMSVFCPVYFLSVSVAKGSVTAVAFYNLVLFFIYLTEVVIVYFLIPAIHVYIMVKVLDFLSSQEYLSKFAELIEVMVSWLLKTLVACTLGFNVVQGMISPAVDTVKRSAVTRTAEAIPGVGDAIGGVTEVVFGTAVLVKNGIGATGMLICLALCIIPLAQTGLVALMYKLAAALIQPLSDKRIAGCVECVGDGCRLLMRVSFTAGFLFLLTIAVVSFVTGSV